MTIRADTICHTANSGKVRRLMAFVRAYRDCCEAIAAKEWRTFFETGKFGGKYANSSKFNEICGAAPAQMARAQVAAMLASFLANRQNDFREAVQRSQLPADTKHQLHVISKRKAWHLRADIPMPGKSAEVIAPEVRQLALSIWRQIRKRHRLPNARGIAPVLDTRVARVSQSTKAHADLWVSLKFVGQTAFRIPLHVHEHWRSRKGARCNVVQFVPAGEGFSIRLMTDMAEAFKESRAAYGARTDRIGVDFGLSTLIATDHGDLMGRGFLDAMRRFDRQITGIARHRQRSGGRARDSQRYCALVNRVRGIIKTRLNTALNLLVNIHTPAEIVVERLDFRLPGLSRRLNRIITNCGRGVFKSKLEDLQQKFGIKLADVNAAYTSQECVRCHFVDRGNRKSQSEFRCLHCGHTAHADVNGAKVVTARRSRGLDQRFASRAQVLGVLRQEFAERHRPGTHASSGQPNRCCCGGHPAGIVGLRGNEAFAGISHDYHECQ